MRRSNFEWQYVHKTLCPQWRTVHKYVANGYGHGKPGPKPLLDDDGRMWLRHFALNNPKVTLKTLRHPLFRWQNVWLSASRVGVILREVGLSRQRINYLAAQRNTPSNLDYARRFAQHVVQFRNPAFFDESGINKQGMSNRRADGWAVKGAGSAFLTRFLRDWPNENITVMAFVDRNGVYGLDVHNGGTTADYCNAYFARAAGVVAARGNDAVIMDNCPAHILHQLQYHFNRVGVSVVMLPRYWPQWNPIELVWNWMKDMLGDRLPYLVRDPVPSIRHALSTVTPKLARSFIKHAGVYPPVVWQ